MTTTVIWGVMKVIWISSLLVQCNGQNSPEDYLATHNYIRNEVGVEEVTWSETLAKFALNYAAKRSDCAIIHSKGPYGENIYEGYGDGFSGGTDAVRWWYEEKPYYDFVNNRCLEEIDCLHYTQMVWKDTRSIGCARLLCENGGFFTTCNYYPPGNVWGERPF